MYLLGDVKAIKTRVRGKFFSSQSSLKPIVLRRPVRTALTAGLVRGYPIRRRCSIYFVVAELKMREIIHDYLI